MASTRLTGKTLKLELDNIDYYGEISEYEFYQDEKNSNTVTFGDAMSGKSGQDKLKIKFTQSVASASLHQLIMDNPGKENVAFTLAPCGNETPSADAPHFVGIATFPALRPSLGLAAGDEDGTAEAELIVTQYEKKITA